MEKYLADVRIEKYAIGYINTLAEREIFSWKFSAMIVLNWNVKLIFLYHEDKKKKINLDFWKNLYKIFKCH